MKKERLNKNFLLEFKDFDFSNIRESRIYLIGSVKFTHQIFVGQLREIIKLITSLYFK